MTFQPGDRVQLKSGGPDMTVEAVNRDYVQDVTCVWFEGIKPYRFSFAEKALKPVDPADVFKAKSVR